MLLLNVVLQRLALLRHEAEPRLVRVQAVPDLLEPLLVFIQRVGHFAVFVAAYSSFYFAIPWESPF